MGYRFLENFRIFRDMERFLEGFFRGKNWNFRMDFESIFRDICVYWPTLRCQQKFGFIKRVDKGEITTVKDLES